MGGMWVKGKGEWEKAKIFIFHNRKSDENI